jgi:hypothetical protein
MRRLPARGLERIRAAPALPFRLTLIANRDPASLEVAAYTREVGSRETAKTDLPLRWPRGVLSLGHVALPFPEDDSVYGLVPKLDGRPEFPLGALTVRGEAGTLLVPLGTLARLRSNPFFSVIRDRIVAAIEADRGKRPRPRNTPRKVQNRILAIGIADASLVGARVRLSHMIPIRKELPCVTKS